MPEDSGTPPEFDLALAEAGAWVGSGPEGIGESAVAPVTEQPLDVEGEDPAVALRQTLGTFATGVTVITTGTEDQVHGMTANAFMSVSLEPPLVLISIARGTKMCDLLHEGAHFAVNVLADDQRELSDRFAGRTGPDAASPSFTIVNDTPLVDGSAAHFVARIARSYWGGDHSLFLGQVEYARRAEGARPLLFHGGQYGSLTAGS